MTLAPGNRRRTPTPGSQPGRPTTAPTNTTDDVDEEQPRDERSGNCEATGAEAHHAIRTATRPVTDETAPPRPHKPSARRTFWTSLTGI